jgi:hypothetical protein
MSAEVGQPPFGWPLPNGYPDVAAAWSSSATTLARWNAHLTFAGHGWPKPLRRPQPASYFGATLPTTYGAAIDVLRGSLCLPPITSTQRAAICRFLDHAPTDTLKPTDALFGWRLPSVLALLLDTPHYSVR